VLYQPVRPVSRDGN